jgi:dTDP-4-amino-4,6-dideoxygalactose transaminase
MEDREIATLQIDRTHTVRQALAAMEHGGLGLLLLVDGAGKFERTVTDGDLRRAILDGLAVDDTLIGLATQASVTIAPDASRREMLEVMNRESINHLPVIDEHGQVVAVRDRRSIDAHILLSTPHMGQAEREFVDQAFQTNWIAPLGPNVDAFERELATWVGIGHAAAVSSGTAAIHLALRLLDVGPGDRVFCSSFTFAASANPIVYQGAEPVFIDSDAESWNMAPEALTRAFEAAQSEGWMPKAVIVVNLYGQSADMDPLVEICDAYGVPIVEDAAESLGATYKGKASGTFGRIGIYSFNGNKIITTSGGGMLVSNDPDLVTRARFLSTQARDAALHYQHSEIGYNYRMSNILAGVGRGQLTVLHDRVAARRAVFARYQAGLSDLDCLEWMPEPDWSYSNRWLTTCTVKPSSGITSLALIRKLADELIETRPLWKPMHQQPVFENCAFYSHRNHPVSDDLFANGVCLPSGSNMTENQIDRIIACVRDVFDTSGNRTKRVAHA